MITSLVPNSTFVLGIPNFDRILIYGTAAIALALGAVAAISPAMFVAVALIDIWLFANPHLIATISRTGFDRISAKQHWFMLYLLPVIVLLGVTILALAYGVSGLFTFYFVAQAYHVTRQSFGISRAYLRAAGSAKAHDYLSEGIVYLLPFWGLLHRCAQAPAEFYGYPVELPGVSPAFADAVGFVACAWSVVWAAIQIWQCLNKSLNSNHCMFVASHLLISWLAFVGSQDITQGWLVLNIWHNLQYLQFVWIQNLRRFAEPRISDTSPIQASAHSVPSEKRQTSYIARLSQKDKLGQCFAIFVALGALVYQGLTFVGEQLVWLGMPTVLILHFTLNYHHYLVDGMIWKRQGFFERILGWLRLPQLKN